jgi:hypothetical protein
MERETVYERKQERKGFASLTVYKTNEEAPIAFSKDVKQVLNNFRFTFFDQVMWIFG